ncbi:MAG: quinolinate synthase NadA [Proteobacteria bacterium]|nr:quinolinate synthase NadA [Pseudomonadota bacterium]
MDNQSLITEIEELKGQKKAVVLAHNYQLPEIQDIADFVGDSLGLSQIAANTDAELIVFCGVNFMAETASIISPDKKVIIPDDQAGCSLAESITVEQLKEWKSAHPGAVVVTYVNSTAEVKAETDYCCTSSNAVKVIQAIPEEKEILFAPDMYLGAYVQVVTGRKLTLWNGCCHIHEKIGEVEISDIRAKHPDAEVVIHPECGCSTTCMLDSTQNPDCNYKIFSTEGMLNYVTESPAKEFLIATEVGILHRMKQNNPKKEFYPVYKEAVCEYMKLVTLEKLRNALKNEQVEVKVPADLADRARVPIERMLSIV